MPTKQPHPVEKAGAATKKTTGKDSKSEGPGAGKSAIKAAVAQPDPRDPLGHFGFEFDRIDRNGDGSLSPDELHQGLLSAGWEQDEVCGLFDKIDLDKNGKISRDEFLNYRSSTTTKPMAFDPKAIFKSLDSNVDGFLDLKEFAPLIKEVNEREGIWYDHEIAKHIREQLAEADKNGDSRLSIEEFLPWYDKFIRFVEDFRASSQLEKKKTPDATPSTNPAAPPVWSGDLWQCPLPKLKEALDAAWSQNKTPFVIDRTGNESSDITPFESFVMFGDYELLEMKKMVVDVNMRKVTTLEAAMEDARKKLVNSFKYGKVLTLMLANSAPPIKTKFTAPDTLPITIFDAKQVAAFQDSAKWEGMWPEKVIRPEDKLDCIRKVRVMVVTKFSLQDYRDFLKDEIPFELTQAVHVFVPP